MTLQTLTNLVWKRHIRNLRDKEKERDKWRNFLEEKGWNVEKIPELHDTNSNSKVFYLLDQNTQSSIRVTCEEPFLNLCQFEHSIYVNGRKQIVLKEVEKNSQKTFELFCFSCSLVSSREVEECGCVDEKSLFSFKGLQFKNFSVPLNNQSLFFFSYLPECSQILHGIDKEEEKDSKYQLSSNSTKTIVILSVDENYSDRIGWWKKKPSYRMYIEGASFVSITSGIRGKTKEFTHKRDSKRWFLVEFTTFCIYLLSSWCHLVWLYFQLITYHESSHYSSRETIIITYGSKSNLSSLQISTPSQQIYPSSSSLPPPLSPSSSSLPPPLSPSSSSLPPPLSPSSSLSSLFSSFPYSPLTPSISLEEGLYFTPWTKRRRDTSFNSPLLEGCSKHFPEFLCSKRNHRIWYLIDEENSLNAQAHRLSAELSHNIVHHPHDINIYFDGELKVSIFPFLRINKNENNFLLFPLHSKNPIKGTQKFIPTFTDHSSLGNAKVNEETVSPHFGNDEIKSNEQEEDQKILCYDNRWTVKRRKNEFWIWFYLYGNKIILNIQLFPIYCLFEFPQPNYSLSINSHLFPSKKKISLPSFLSRSSTLSTSTSSLTLLSPPKSSFEEKCIGASSFFISFWKDLFILLSHSICIFVIPIFYFLFRISIYPIVNWFCTFNSQKLYFKKDFVFVREYQINQDQYEPFDTQEELSPLLKIN